ncbi:MAG TPA: ribbon-helix-helix domain-containing protein [Ilumatobacteraceae bacterium]|nr:ribbon-helix-helix domain-containing protein [Ilumatobacteraceae bacterium]HRB02390.1 ribbon-helix-helix domain-containing protein [Ilumatobacteraceae bacterium]
MKVSVSLPDDDVEFLDTYAEREGFASRSAVVHKAVRMLRASELGSAYEDAWAEWATGDDSGVWGTATADGLSDATG